MTPALGTAPDDSPVELDLEALIGSHLGIQGNTGAGKSRTIRKVLELAAGQAQRIVLDVEDEFYTLREASPQLVIAGGDNGDCPATVANAASLARFLLETGLDAVVQINDLGLHDRRAFIARFLGAVIDAPKALWHPALIVLDEAHRYCMDADTEILGPAGWLKWDQVSVGTEVVAFHPATSSFRNEAVLDVLRREHDGEMVRLRTKGLDCLVTPDHRVVLQRVQRAAGRGGTVYPWTFCPAAQVPTNVRVPIGGAPEGGGIADLSARLLRVIGWIITDGYNAAARNALGLQQALCTEKRGLNMVAEMDAVLRAEFGDVGRYERPAREKNTASIAYYLPQRAANRIRCWLDLADGQPMAPKIERRVPRRLITETSPAQLRALFAGLIEGDGSADKFYPGVNEGLADDFQEIATRLGISTTKTLITSQGQWHVSISGRQHHHVTRAQRASYTGMVWDITVPSGAFVARRNGRVFVTGNCPQDGSAESLDAVVALMAQGRKRGYTGILATQRLAKINKDATGEINNWLMGRVGQALDRRAVADELGFAPKGEEAMGLRRLQPGRFWGFGPAIASEPVLIHVGAVETTHLKRGQRNVPTPPAPEKIRSMMARLAKETATGTAESGNGKAGTGNDVAATGDTTEVQQLLDYVAELEGAAKAREAEIAELDAENDRWQGLVQTIETAIAEFLAGRSAEQRPPPQPAEPAAPAPTPPVIPRDETSGRKPNGSDPSVGAPLGSGQRKILTVLAQHPAGRTRQQLAIQAGYAIGGGGFRNLLSGLRVAGLLTGTGDELLRITPAGRVALGPVEPLPTGPALVDWWCGQLEKAPRLILRHLVASYPATVGRRQIAEATGYEANGGGFRNALSKLRVLKLAHGSAKLRAADEFFDQGGRA